MESPRAPAEQRPRAPSEHRHRRSDVDRAKRQRRRTQQDAGRDALRPGPGRVLIEGRRPVLESLRTGRAVDRVLIAAGATPHGPLADVVELARAKQIPVQPVSRPLLDAQSSTASHQGVIAVAAALEPISLEELLAVPLADPEPPLFLVLDGVEDPRNLGALARSAEAVGCHGLVVPRHRSAPLSAAAEKASAGALAHLPVAEVVNLARALQQLRDAGIWCVGLAEDGAASLFGLDLRDLPVAIVVGGEGEGIRRLVRESCDVVASIPMRGSVGSLNASVAGALALYEVRRQRVALARPPARGTAVGLPRPAGVAQSGSASDL